jgi:hypothetical protein
MRSHNCAELVSSRSIQEEKKLPVSGRDVKFSSYCLAAFLSDGTDGCGLALTRMPTEASAHRRACTRTFTHPPPRRRGWWWRSMGYKRRCCRPRPPPRSTRADALLVTRSPRLPAAWFARGCSCPAEEQWLGRASPGWGSTALILRRRSDEIRRQVAAGGRRNGSTARGLAGRLCFRRFGLLPAWVQTGEEYGRSNWYWFGRHVDEYRVPYLWEFYLDGKAGDKGRGRQRR